MADAFNTRFDLSSNGAHTCPSGTCSPSRNVRKDLVTNSNGSGYNCGTNGANNWRQPNNPYTGQASATALPTSGANDPDVMGHPRDMCHYSTAGCGGRNIMGNGSWDRDAYFRVNYGWTSAQWKTQTGLGANVSRYDVYLWELAHTSLADKRQPTNGNPAAYSYPVCRAPGITPGGSNVDRRRMSVAVVNCKANEIRGNSSQPITAVTNLDVFLVEPSWVRKRGSTKITDANEFYAEVIGITGSGANGSTASQVIRRDVPRLIE